MRPAIKPILFAATLLFLPAALVAQPMATPQRGGQTVRQSTSSVPADRIAPGDAPPDPYADELPELALQSQDAFMEALHRQVLEMVRTSVGEEIHRLRRENTAMESRLQRITDDATRAIRDARENALGSTTPEMRLQRAFQREFRRQLNNALDPLAEELNDQERAQLRAAVTTLVGDLTPLSLFRSIQMEAGEDGDSARLTSPRPGMTDGLTDQLKDLLVEGGLVLDESRLKALQEGIGKLSTLEEIEVTLETTRGRRRN